jgi:hypothetical protein
MTFSRGLNLPPFFCQMMLYQVAVSGSFCVGAGFPRPGAARRRPYKRRRKKENGNVGADPRVRPLAGCARRILAATGRPIRLPFLMNLTLKGRNDHHQAKSD